MKTATQIALSVVVSWSCLNMILSTVGNSHAKDQSRVVAESPSFKTYLPSACRGCLPTGTFIATPTPPVPQSPALSVYSDCNRTTKADYDNNGSIDAILAARFNSSGHLSRVEMDNDQDGVIDRIEEDDYAADGQLLRSRWYVRSGGERNFEIEYSYNEVGAIVRRDRRRLPGNALVFHEEWAYRSDGRMERSLVDGDVDGRPDIESRYVYDIGGRRIGESVFRDGQLDLTYTYIISGSLLVGMQSDPGPGNTTRKREVIEYTYDSEDRFVGIEARLRDDGKVLWGNAYTYNMNGMVESSTSYYTRGIPEEIAWTAYDDKGRMIELIYGDRAIPDATLEFEYNCSE